MDFLGLLESLLPNAAQWNNIGLLLGLGKGELDTIEADSNGVEESLKRVLQKWYGRSPHPQWEEVIAALKSPLVGDTELAKKLEGKVAIPGVATGILKENMAKIKHSFAKLVVKVTAKLEGRSRSQDIDMKEFRLHILTLFGDIIAGALNVTDIIAAVSRHQLWDYSCCTPIEKIAEEFGGDDSELRELIRKYKLELSGFKAVTKIVDYIKVCSEEQDIADSTQSIKEDMARYDLGYCRKLTFKLKSRIVGKSLPYIDELWRSIADHFLLPSLTAVLDSIHKGCVKVTWLVPTLFALQIQANIQDSAEFLEKLEVVRVMMDYTILHEGDKNKLKHLTLPESSMLTKEDMDSMKRLVLIEELDMLADNFTPQRYLPALRSRGLLDRHDCEVITHEVTIEGKVMKFVDSICEGRMGKDGEHAFDVLMEELVREGTHTYAARQLQKALKKAVERALERALERFDTGYSGSGEDNLLEIGKSVVQNILQKLKSEDYESIIIFLESEFPQELEPEHLRIDLPTRTSSEFDTNMLKRKVLKDKLVMLADNFSPQRYLPALRSRGILGRQDCEVISSEVTTRGKVEKFVDIIYQWNWRQGGGKHAFDVLVEVMREGVHTYAAGQLQQALKRAIHIDHFHGFHGQQALQETGDPSVQGQVIYSTPHGQSKEGSLLPSDEVSIFSTHPRPLHDKSLHDDSETSDTSDTSDTIKGQPQIYSK